MIEIPHKCPRGRTDCIALSNIIADDGSSFFCCGEHDGKESYIEGDKYTVCFKGEYNDERAFHDKRDLLHLSSVVLKSVAIIQKSYDDNEDWSAWIESNE